MKVYQVLGSLYKGDAIGNCALIIDNIIKKSGYDTRIYSQTITGEFPKGTAALIHDMPEPSPDDIILYHLGQGVFKDIRITEYHCKKIAIYHNSTPSHFFEPFDPIQAFNQIVAKEEIESLNETFDYCFADSEFNKTDLTGMGYPVDKIEVMPIIISFEDFKRKPDPTTMKNYDDGRTNILFVGRIAPNKKHEDIIKAFAYYKKHLNSEARLILAGSTNTPNYKKCLEDYVKALQIEDVIFPGHITFEEILGLYRTADIFLSMSEHEGFCVPLLEAMLFDLPIIAFNCAAVPDTLGGSGILVDTKDAVFLSLLMDKVVNDKDLRDAVIHSQRCRLQDFDTMALSKQFIEKFENIIKKI